MTRLHTSRPSYATAIAVALAVSTCTACVGPATGRVFHLAASWEAPRDHETPEGAVAAPAKPAADAAIAPSGDASRPLEADASHENADEATPVPRKRWHVDLAVRGSHTKLTATKQQLDRRLDLPLKLDVLGVFDHPYTPIDRKTDLGLMTWYAGVGREESRRFIWTYYAGAGAGEDLNHQRFLNETLEVDFKYGYYYTGVRAEYYPWEVPALSAARSWADRLRSSRPFLLAGFESGYVSAEGEGNYAVNGMNSYHDDQKVRDWLFSCPIGLGWALPLDDHWSVNLAGDYTFHFYRPEEYNGWNVTTALRYRF